MDVIKQCEVCGVFFREQKSCPHCAAFASYFKQNEFFLKGDEDNFTKFHKWLEKETDLNVPPIVVAAAYKYMNIRESF